MCRCVYVSHRNGVPMDLKIIVEDLDRKTITGAENLMVGML